jgi:hypothetical protein
MLSIDRIEGQKPQLNFQLSKHEPVIDRQGDIQKVNNGWKLGADDPNKISTYYEAKEKKIARNIKSKLQKLDRNNAENIGIKSHELALDEQRRQRIGVLKKAAAKNEKTEEMYKFTFLLKAVTNIKNSISKLMSI